MKPSAVAITVVTSILVLVLILFLFALPSITWNNRICNWYVPEALLLDVAEPSPFPIDFVVTWVDSSDPSWQTRKQETLRRKRPASGYEDARFPDPASPDLELNTCISSIQRFAPFARCIWVVTQRPQAPPKLAEYNASGKVPVRVVHHDEMRGNDDLLFNSHAIEADIHKIPGLSEQFVYANDDVYLGNDVFPRDFFTKDGKALHSLSLVWRNPKGKDQWSRHVETNYAMLWKHVPQILHYWTSHVHVALTKTDCERAEAYYLNDYQITRQNQFRDPKTDIPPVGATALLSLKTNQAYLRPRDEPITIVQRPFGGKSELAETFMSQNVDDTNLVAVNKRLLPPPARVLDECVLMLVAHPDDETIFGATDFFLAKRIHVVCMTNKANPTRMKELKRVTACFKDTVSVSVFDWKPTIPDILASIPMLPYTLVVSHAEDGEYGHKQHIETHYTAKQLAGDKSLPFSTFAERATLSDCSDELDEAQQRALRIYKSQNIKKFTKCAKAYSSCDAELSPGRKCA